jgi:hypothetical protein
VNLFLLHHSLNDPFLDGDMSITLFGMRKIILIDSLIFYLSSSTFCELLLLLEKQDYRRGHCCVRCLAQYNEHLPRGPAISGVSRVGV